MRPPETSRKAKRSKADGACDGKERVVPTGRAATKECASGKGTLPHVLSPHTMFFSTRRDGMLAPGFYPQPQALSSPLITLPSNNTASGKTHKVEMDVNVVFVAFENGVINKAHRISLTNMRNLIQTKVR